MSSAPTPQPLPPSSSQGTTPAAPQFTFGGYTGQPGGLNGVGFWPRAGARVIDLVIHYIVYFCSAIVFGVMVGVVAGLSGTPTGPLIAKMTAGGVPAFLLAVLGSMAYHTVCEAGSGVTLGKLAIGAVVVQEDGSRCRFGPAAIRSASYLVDALFFGVVGYLQMQKTPQQQRHGDNWAHTVVVKKEATAHAPNGGRFFAIFVLACLADAATALLGLTLKML